MLYWLLMQIPAQLIIIHYFLYSYPLTIYSGTPVLWYGEGAVKS